MSKKIKISSRLRPDMRFFSFMFGSAKYFVIYSYRLTSQMTIAGKDMKINATMPRIICALKILFLFSGVSGAGGIPHSSSLGL